jgi:Rab GDP dissociation inhibitor
VLFDEEGKVRGIRCGEECAYAPKVLCDPSYVLDIGKVRPTGRVVRAVCVLNHPIPNTRDSSSSQLIIPQRQTGRQNDIFVCMVSSVHCVCAAGYYVAIVSTTVETDTPEAELGPAFALMGDIMHQFIKVYDTYEPLGSGLEDNLFISTSYDATSHFESACEDVLGLFERITGAPLDYSQPMQPRMW